ncbi:MAG: carboxyl transferase domain-containing protein, partial [Catenibacillus sp.]|nr:carboxyl transferase domain-containing protein [Catenibacillus sp.]
MNNSKQMSARERIEFLLDDNSFVEIGALVSARNTDFNMTNIEMPSDGVVTGYGTVDDSLVYVYSQDASVLGGSIGEMHAKKIAKVYEMAMKVGVPVVGFIDCAGMRLQEATDALDAFGNLYALQTKASGVIPQLTAIFGTCGGGAALIPAMTDFTFMSKEGRLFVNTPNALLGNEISKCDTAEAAYQAKAGLVDVLCEDEQETIGKVRELLCLLPSNNDDSALYDVCEDDLNRENPALSGCMDTAYILRDISDNYKFFETKGEYAKEMVTGFISLNGQTVGAVANRTEILDENGEVSETMDALLT